MNTPVFDRLVSSLSAEERKGMLEKLSPLHSEGSEVLTTGELVEQGERSIGEMYKNLTFWQKLWFQFVAFIDKRSQEEVFHQQLLRALKRTLVEQHHQYIDFSKSRFSADFCLQIVALSKELEFLRIPMEDVLGEHRREYNAFCVGFMAPEVQDTLLVQSDLSTIEQRMPESEELTPGKIRVFLEESVEASIQLMDNALRERLYGYAREVAHLERLVSFNYDKVMANFSTDNSCTIKLIAKQIKKLNSILSSWEKIPSSEVMQSIFLFSYARHQVDKAQIPSLLAQDMEQMQLLSQRVKGFLQIPLTQMLAVISDDYCYAPQLLSGGENWLNSYRKFWRNRSHRLFQEFLLKKKVQNLGNEIANFYHLKGIWSLRGYTTQEWSPAVFKPVYEKSMALTLYFFQTVYLGQCAVVLEKLNEDASFVRRDNGKALAGALLSIPLLSKEIDDFEQAMSPDGGYFYLQLKEFVQGTRAQGLQSVITFIEKHVTLILERSVEVLMTLSAVLGGILERSIGQQYDGINNLDAIGVEKSKLEAMHTIVMSSYQFLVDTKDLEERVRHLVVENDKELDMVVAE
jgi:Family of unknown function (DUF5312)